MYKQISDHNESPVRDTNSSGRITDGWLIERPVLSGKGEEPRYLQIGTGQWCAATYATLFPHRRTAVSYAVDFGYQPGTTARIVRFRQPS